MLFSCMLSDSHAEFIPASGRSRMQARAQDIEYLNCGGECGLNAVGLKKKTCFLCCSHSITSWGFKFDLM